MSRTSGIHIAVGKRDTLTLYWGDLGQQQQQQQQGMHRRVAAGLTRLDETACKARSRALAPQSRVELPPRVVGG